MNPTGQCTVCGQARQMLFSNRPLHKGRDVTLLICSHCVAQAEQQEASHTIAACSWCGNQGGGKTAVGSFLICANCITNCKIILTETA